MKNFYFGVGVSKITQNEVLEEILISLKKPSEKYYVVTPNPEIIVYATKHPGFKKVLNEAKIAICDGIGLFLAAKVLKNPLKERIAGIDLVENLCAKVSNQIVTVGFLGGKPGIAELTAECLKKKYSGLTIVLAEAGNPDEKTTQMIIERMRKGVSIGLGTRSNDIDRYLQIQKTKTHQPQTEQKTFYHIDILFVAFGFPKQEEWMNRYLSKLPVTVAIAVGGAFDYISGSVPRAPKFLRYVGFEWLYRLITQPWRIKRQLSIVEFVFMVIKARLFGISDY